jgi:hypothetical protein
MLSFDVTTPAANGFSPLCLIRLRGIRVLLLREGSLVGLSALESDTIFWW